MKKITFFALGSLLLPLAADVTLPLPEKAEQDWSSAFQAAAAKERIIRIPRGKYTFAKPVVITRDTRLIFAEGAHFNFKVSPGIIVAGGKLRLESSGDGALITGEGKFNYPHSRGSIIDLNRSGHDPKMKAASLSMENIEMRGDFCIDGCNRNRLPVKIGAIEIHKCRFISNQRGVYILAPEVASIKVTESLFKGGVFGFQVDAAIPGGAYVCGNIFRNIGRSALMLGKSGQVAEGCTKHLPNAIIHDNQILQGGHMSSSRNLYIHGMLIYGHNVSVQGNIVRDFNRGVPVPGARCGHHIVENGKIYRSRTNYVNGKKLIISGSAIYLKANRAIVHGNICTNSGWRSVIEIKTGGKEYFSSVVNNVVDGRSLAIGESYAFECNSGRSIWANNIVYDVPYQAFVVRSGFENSFMNNLVVNARVGFGLSGSTPGQNELISGNRFIDVQYPVAIDGKKLLHAGGLDVHTMPPSHLPPKADLPPASQKNAGRMIFKGQSLYCCVNTGKGFAWMELAGKLIPEKKWRATGPELFRDSDQSGKETFAAPLNNPLYPGWHCIMRNAGEKVLDPKDGHIAFDTKEFLSGGRSLRVRFKGTAGQFALYRSLDLEPGKRYRATAKVKGEEPRNIHLEVGFPGGFSEQIRGEENPNWQILSVDFTMPEKGSRCILYFRGAKTTEGKAIWLDSISVRELEDASKPLPPVRKTVGKELLPPFVSAKADAAPANWNAFSPAKVTFKNEKEGVWACTTVDKTGSVMLTSLRKLAAGKSYRFAFEVLCAKPATFTPSVRIGKKDVSGKVTSLDRWLPCHVDFTLPKGTNQAQLRLWCGSLAPRKYFKLRNLSLKELEK
ncbi:MAG: hypothetical protein J6S54_11175 [Lentisphaeria bacterium]|nr:hypothetical protein [Lentisphaeria bacterium]